jgi:hypothetical protein
MAVHAPVGILRRIFKKVGGVEAEFLADLDHRRASGTARRARQYPMERP